MIKYLIIGLLTLYATGVSAQTVVGAKMPFYGRERFNHRYHTSYSNLPRFKKDARSEERTRLKLPTAMDSGCPMGYFRYEDSCFLFSPTRRTWNSARMECQQSGGDLATINSKEELEFIQNKLKGTRIPRNQHCWIGLHKERIWTPYKWMNGDPVQYIPWVPDYTGQEVVGYVTVCLTNLHFLPKTNRDELNPFLCVASVTDSPNAGAVDDVNQPVEKDRTHGDKNTQEQEVAERQASLRDGWKSFEGKRYKAFYEKKTFEEARAACEEQGANLLSLHSPRESEFVMQQVVGSDRPDDMYWLGLSNEANGLQWPDGSPFDFSYWFPSITVLHPRGRLQSLFSKKERTGDELMKLCYEVDSDDSLWTSVDCQQTRYYICDASEDQHPSTATTLTGKKGLTEKKPKEDDSDKLKKDSMLAGSIASATNQKQNIGEQNPDSLTKSAPKAKRRRPKKNETDPDTLTTSAPRAKRGRPKKNVVVNSKADGEKLNPDSINDEGTESEIKTSQMGKPLNNAEQNSDLLTTSAPRAKRGRPKKNDTGHLTTSAPKARRGRPKKNVAEDSKEIGQKLNPDSVQGGGTESEIKSFEMRKPPINAEKKTDPDSLTKSAPITKRGRPRKNVVDNSKETGQKLKPDSVQEGGTQSEIKTSEIRKSPNNGEKNPDPLTESAPRAKIGRPKKIVVDNSKESEQKLNPDSVQGGGTESEIKTSEIIRKPINNEEKTDPDSLTKSAPTATRGRPKKTDPDLLTTSAPRAQRGRSRKNVVVNSKADGEKLNPDSMNDGGTESEIQTSEIRKPLNNADQNPHPLNTSKPIRKTGRPAKKPKEKVVVNSKPVWDTFYPDSMNDGGTESEIQTSEIRKPLNNADQNPDSLTTSKPIRKRGRPAKKPKEKDPDSLTTSKPIRKRGRPAQKPKEKVVVNSKPVWDTFYPDSVQDGDMASAIKTSEINKTLNIGKQKSALADFGSEDDSNPITVTLLVVLVGSVVLMAAVFGAVIWRRQHGNSRFPWTSLKDSSTDESHNLQDVRLSSRYAETSDVNQRGNYGAME
ncbi:hypothetical protein RRG08_058161 [Elysia crispata]|uniref:C-type lectin domain-containing protein n=1 Tax=Elysia crispata TaxID=231223 RepID=A0AAE0Y1Q2_9GAST|nr:hypothetical protein RRG08_058161 [Elysia crispata]